MKYYCEQCDEIIDNPEEIEDDPSPSGVSLPSGCYTYLVCPYCGDYVEEAEKCELCGEYVKSTNEGVCEECGDKIHKGLEKIVDEFTGVNGNDSEDAKNTILDYIADRYM